MVLSKTFHHDEKNIKNAMNATNPFKYLDENQIGELEFYGQIIEYESEQRILMQGKPGTGLYIIINGEAKVSVNMLGEGNMELKRLKHGDFFGEVSLLEDSPCTATVTATKQLCCFFISKQCFEAFFLIKPEIRYLINRSLLEEVIKRQQQMSNKISKLIQKQSIERHSISALNQGYEGLDLQKYQAKEFDYLYNLPVFKVFSKTEFSDLIDHAQRIVMNKHTDLICVNNINSSLYFIISGSLQLNINSKGKKSRFAVLGPNTLICPISSIEKQSEMFHYITNDLVVMLEIPSHYLEQIAKENPHLWYKFFDLICRYTVLLQRNLNSLIVRLTHEKLKSLVKE
ncbi:cyclic nucleotide-binding domain-containing protein [Legionella maioricensis]|uniref:Cyclic nucleotide-binding domain-containing protein n=1 Tax=Legionella maioricensis TaxID=2896528 RepID=A0A9X2D3A5_9GAMM|nr:cyclic nucleotide-binding domain-containing protein [Legionella maioricensis]MCL9685636.1 cyclic nucleotide-binding domain-containing protein [Legionella maioricensis]MCL9689045.1 cyclic nucleotide-binding domain-containing protein [Legionella maioricensis]